MVFPKCPFRTIHDRVASLPLVSLHDHPNDLANPLRGSNQRAGDVPGSASGHDCDGYANDQGGVSYPCKRNSLIDCTYLIRIQI